jgi:PII-like signaling protein
MLRLSSRVPVVVADVGTEEKEFIVNFEDVLHEVKYLLV